MDENRRPTWKKVLLKIVYAAVTSRNVSDTTIQIVTTSSRQFSVGTTSLKQIPWIGKAALLVIPPTDFSTRSYGWQGGGRFSLHDGITYADGINWIGDMKTQIVTNLLQMQDVMMKSTSESSSNSFKFAPEIAAELEAKKIKSTLKFGFDVKYAESDT